MGKGKVEVGIELTGAQEYKRAITAITSAQRELRSEMKTMESTFKGAQNSVEALKTKYSILNRQYETQAQKVNVYETALEKSLQKEEKASAKVEELTQKYEEEKSALDELKNSETATTEEIENQERKIQTLSSQLQVAQSDYLNAQTVTSRYQTSLNEATLELNQMGQELTRTGQHLEEAEQSINGTAQSIDEFGNETEEAERQTQSFGQNLMATFTAQALLDGIKKIAGAVKDVAMACIETGMEFEASMSKVAAVSGATGAELEALTEKAKQMGATTMFSASEAANAMNYMAMAGWKTEDMLSGIEGIMNLAAASGADLATTSDIVTDALTAFGLTAADSAHFADILAAASSNANTNVEMMGETFKYCAPIAGALGYTAEDTAFAIGLMANAGIKSSQAGTSLRRIMTELNGDVKITGDAIGEVVISTTNADGTMREFSDTITDLRNVFSKLTESEKAATAEGLVGKNALSGFLALMNAAPSDVEKLTAAIDTCDGATARMADTMQNNLKGKLTILGSAMDALKESVYETFDDGLKKGVTDATDAVSRLNEAVAHGNLGVSLSRLGDAMGELIDEVALFVERNLPALVDGLTGVVENAELIGLALESVVAGLIAVKAATTTIAATRAAMELLAASTELAAAKQAILNAVMSMNPYVVTTAAILTVVTALGFLAGSAAPKAKKEYNELQKASISLSKESEHLRESFTENAQTFDETSESIEATEATAKGLADRLVELNDKWKDKAGAEGFNEAVADQKAIIEELKAAYPDLNLSIDEQTGALSASTAELYANIEAMKRQAEQAAVQERLKEIAREKLELENQNYTLGKQIDEQEKEHQSTLKGIKEAEQQVNEEAEKYNRVTDESIDAVSDAVEANKNSAHALSELKGEYYANENAIAELEEQQTQLIDTQLKLADSADQAADAANNAANGYDRFWLSADKLETMTENVSKAIDEQTDLFNEHEKTVETSKQQLENNLEEQIDALTQWSSSFEQLTQKAGGAIDENLLMQLAEMGPKSQGYIDAMLSMTDAEFTEYSNKFGEALTLKEETSAKIIESYTNTGKDTADAFVDGVVEETEAKASEIADAAVDAIEDANEEASGEAKKAKDVGKEIDDSTAQGVKENANKPKTETATMGKAVLKTAQTEMGKEKFTAVGKNITAGIVAGIKEGTSDVLKAIKALAEQAAKAVAENVKASNTGGDNKSNGNTGSKTASLGSYDAQRSASVSMDETFAAGASAMTTPSSLDTNSLTSAITHAISSGLDSFTMRVNADVDRDAIVKITVDNDREHYIRKGVGQYV